MEHQILGGGSLINVFTPIKIGSIYASNKMQDPASVVLEFLDMKAPATGKIMKLLDKCRVPCVDHSLTGDSVRLISSDLLSARDFLLRLPDAGFNVTFDHEFVRHAMGKMKRARRGAIDVVSHSVIAMALAWVIEFERTKLTDAFCLMLDGLNMISIGSYGSVAANMFVFIFSEVTTSVPEYPITDLQDPLIRFFQSAPGRTEMVLTWLGELIRASPRDGLSKDAVDVLVFVTQNIGAGGPFGTNGNDLFLLIRERTHILDLQSLIFLSKFVDFIDRDCIENWASNIPKYVADFLKTQREVVGHIDLSALKDAETVTQVTAFSGIVQGDENRTFQDFDFTEISGEPIVPDEVGVRITFIAEKFGVFGEQIVDSMIDEADKGNLSPSTACVWLMLARKLDKGDKLRFLGSVISSTLFSPKVTIFDDDWIQHRDLFRVRKLACDMFLVCGGDVKFLWRTWQRFPRSVQELFVFLRNRPPMSSQDAVDLVCEVLGAYRMDYLDVVYQVFVFVRDSLNDVTNILAFLESDKFVNIYTWLFFQKEFAKEAVGLLIDSLLRHDVAVKLAVCPGLVSLLIVIHKKIGMDGSVELAMTIFDGFIHLLREKPELIPHFAFMTESVCQILPVCRSKKFLYKSMLLMSVVSNGAMRSSERIALLKTILAIEGVDPSVECFNSILVMASGDSSGSRVMSDGHKFAVVQGRAFAVFIEAFWTSVKITDYLKFIYDICNYSIANCEACHCGNVAMLLVQLVTKANAVTESVSMALSVVAVIASVVSSIPVVAKFIAMMCPVENKFVSPIVGHAIDKMYQIVKTRYNAPSASLSLPGSTRVLIENLSGKFMRTGVTILMWIYLDEIAASSSVQLIRLVSERTRCEICVAVDKLDVSTSFRSDSGLHGEEFGLTLPLKRWTLVAVTFHRPGIELIAATTFCEEKTSTKSFDGWKEADNSVWRCEIGGAGERRALLLGRFGVLPTTSRKDLALIMRDGPGVAFREKGLLSVEIKSENGRICLCDSVADGQIGAVLKGPSVGQRMSFADILVRFLTVDVVIPLFAQVGLVTGDAAKDSFIESVMKLFFSVVRVAPKSDPDISAVVYLLAKVPDQLTSHFYLALYHQFEKISSERQKVVIFNELIMNVDLWFTRNDLDVDDDMVQIVSHWSHDLNLAYMATVFEELLGRIVNRFWNEKMGDVTDTVKIARVHAVDFLIRVLVEGPLALAAKDMEQIVGLVMLGNNGLSVAMLQLIASFPFHRIDPSGIKELKRSLLTLYHLAKLGDCDVSLQLVRTISELHEKDMLEARFSAVIHSESLLRFMMPCSFNKEFLEGVIDIATRDAVFIPIVCMAATNVGVEGSRLISRAITPKMECCSHLAWAMWPCIAALANQSELLDAMINLVLRSVSVGDWMHTYGIVIMVTIASGHDEGLLPKRFLLKVGNEFVVDQATTVEYVHMCFYELFCRPPKLLGKEVTDPSCESFRSNVSTFVAHEAKQEKVFNPRKDASGGWCDVDLAIDCMTLIIDHAVTQFFDIAALLACMIIGEVNSLDISSYVKRLVDSQKISDEYRRLLQARLHEDNVDFRGVNFGDMFAVRGFRQYRNMIYRARSKVGRAGGYIETLHKNVSKHQTMCDALPGRENIMRVVPRNITVELRPRWEKLWGYLTCDKGPWYQASGIDGIKWTRSSSLCTFGIPAKMRRNFEFNSHIDASYNRDMGSLVEAKKKMEDYNLDLARRRKETVAEILDVAAVRRNSKAHSHKFTDKRHVLEYEGAVLYTLKKNRAIRRFVVYHSRIELEMESGKTKVIPAQNVHGIFKRVHLQRPRAIEIFAEYGRSYLIVFNDVFIDTKRILWPIRYADGYGHCQIQTRPWADWFREQKHTEEWKNGNISTFKYLLLLNLFSSRSFNNASIYPVFPWVIQDFVSDSVRLDDPSFFRDLSKPIGATDSERLAYVQRQERELKAAGRNHLWSSYAVSPFWVYLWLMRMEPFATFHIAMQSGKFDYAARLFASVSDSYKMVTTHQNDYRELIPEFFFQPEFLVNSNQFDLGKTSVGRVNDVQLPPWAKTPYDFVYLHRKALESDTVSAHINEWIDLIWGYKQRGVEAKNSFNTYDPFIYDTAWTEETTADPILRLTIEETMSCFGQIPPQMFNSPHPVRANRSTPLTVKIDRQMDLGTGKIVYSRVVREKDLSYNIIACNERGHFVRTTVVPDEVVQISISDDAISLDAVTAISEVMANTVAVASDGGVKMYDIVNGTSKDLSCETGRVNCFAASKRNIVSGGSDTVIRCWLIDVTKTCCEQHTTSSYSGVIRCVAISRSHNVIVAGSSDGSVLVIDAETGIVTHAIDLERKAHPDNIIITDEWGFIIVYATVVAEEGVEHWIYLFSINGELIRKLQINAGVSVWTSWVSNDGFDYIFMADKLGRLYRFEAYYLNLGNEIGHCRGVSSLYYDRFVDVGVVVKQDGCVLMKSWKW